MCRPILAKPSTIPYRISAINRCRSRMMAIAEAARPKSELYRWSFEGNEFDVPYDVAGKGKKLLLLPSMNMGSTRLEMRSLSRLLGNTFQTFACDWPGFGDASRVNLYYTPALFYSFVLDFIREVLKESETPVIASGHASSFVLKLARQHPALWTRIMLISPTYKSPGTAMGMHPLVGMFMRGAFRTPWIGEMLYARVKDPQFLRKQYENHVFKDTTLVTEEFITERYNVVNKPGGAYGPSCFFTGRLDVIKDRDELMELATSTSCPLKIIYGDSSPAKSLAEMEALAAKEGLDVTCLSGSLGLAEEIPTAVADVVSPFLKAK